MQSSSSGDVCITVLYRRRKGWCQSLSPLALLCAAQGLRRKEGKVVWELLLGLCALCKMFGMFGRQQRRALCAAVGSAALQHM